MSKARPFDAEENWINVLPPTSGKGFDGYIGKWGRFDGSGNQLLGWDGVRMFRVEEDASSGEQYNIYSDQRPGAEPREDGGFEKRWQYSRAEHQKHDGWWHPFMIADGPMRSRAMAARRGLVTSICHSLPLPENLAQHEPPPPFFVDELFFRAPDESRSWSGGPLFDVKTGSLQTIFFIREYRVEGVVPSQPFSLKERPEVLPPRGLLPENPGEWLEGGGWRGVTQGLVWDAEGNISHTAQQEVDWAPPKSDNSLTLLPDLFYASFPEPLPTSADAIPVEGVSIEMGGRTSESSFRKTVVSYDQSGRIASIRHDEFSRA